MHRLGCIEEREPIRQHPFYSSIDWVKLEKGQIPPPFRPAVVSRNGINKNTYVQIASIHLSLIGSSLKVFDLPGLIYTVHKP